MPRGVKKENLPSKICVSCQRPFTWRKKWERCWDEVQTCSKRCNAERKKSGSAASATDTASNDDAAAGDDDDGPRLSARKMAKKAMKAERREKRAGVASASTGRKACDVCDASVNLLVRCRTDETRQWKMVCGSCWTAVSGGVPDGDAAHPHYQYGGLWRNRNPQSGEGLAADDALAAVIGSA